jgi:L-alanine-DL-glutamate epimerase-like enolase superfamily enzyme
MRAIAAIDIALWDIVGKSLIFRFIKCLVVFVRQLLFITAAATTRFLQNKVRVALLPRKRNGYIQRPRFGAFKMKIGAGEMNLDLERIATARKTIGPDAKLMLDANCRYGPETIIAMAAKFEKYDIAWLEEPVLLTTSQLRLCCFQGFHAGGLG